MSSSKSKRGRERAHAWASLLEQSAQLWDDVCSKRTPASMAELLRDDHAIRTAVEAMRRLQTNTTGGGRSQASRADTVAALHKWAALMGVQFDHLRVQPVPPGDTEQYGLFAADTVQGGQRVVNVPRKAMLSWDDARTSDYMKQAMANDPMLLQMSNVSLAMFVLCEKHRGAASPWAAYIASLPDAHDTPLYLPHAALRRIAAASPSFAERTLRMYRSVARQYCYFHIMLSVSNKDESTARRNWLAQSPLTPANFTFDDYLWAVATVGSRINMVPSDTVRHGDKPAMVPALIPLLDMANHSDDSKCMLQFDAVSAAAELRAQCDYDAGEQVLIYYGDRTADEFLLHNGFVPDAAAVQVAVRLGLSQGDKRLAARVEALAARQLGAHETFAVDGRGEPAVPAAMLRYAEVFVADVDDTGQLVLGTDANTAKAWLYLKNRFALMRMAYKKVIGDGDFCEAGPIQGLTAKLLVMEEQLIAAAEAYCNKQCASP